MSSEKYGNFVLLDMIRENFFKSEELRMVFRRANDGKNLPPQKGENTGASLGNKSVNLILQFYRDWTM